MNTAAAALSASPSRPHLGHKAGPVTAIIFIGVLAIGLLFTGYSLVSDISDAGGKLITWVRLDIRCCFRHSSVLVVPHYCCWRSEPW